MTLLSSSSSSDSSQLAIVSGFEPSSHGSQEPSQGPVSLLQKKFKSAPPQIRPEVSISFIAASKDPGKNSNIYRISLDPGEVTVRQAISHAVQKFNHVYALKLEQKPEAYQLYAARKSGKRQSDFPAIENEQFLIKTKINNFTLVPLKQNQIAFDDMKLNAHSFFSSAQNMDKNGTLTTIKSEIDLQNTGNSSKDIELPKLSKRQRLLNWLCIN